MEGTEEIKGDTLIDNNQNRSQFKLKIILIIFGIIILALIISLIVVINKINDKDDEINAIKAEKSEVETKLKDLNNNLAYLVQMKNDGLWEDWYNIYGVKIENISYAENEIILNTYKTGGRNYKSDIKVNNDLDYEKTDRNVYDLYIPKSALDSKTENYGVILFVHGGSWISETKNQLDYLASRYSKMGYITATMDYTLVIPQYKSKGYNIYRMLDEIDACYKSIKKELNKKGFVISNLKFAIGGYSAGGHLVLNYAYNYIKEENFEIKFIIDIAGPITIEYNYYKKLKEGMEPLEQNIFIDNDEIKKLENDLELVFNIDIYLAYLNAFSEDSKTPEQIQNIIKDGKIDDTNEDYQFLINYNKYSIPINNVNSSIPILCYYDGKDQYVGVTQYSYLKKAYGDSTNIELIYSKNVDHMFTPVVTEDDIEVTRNFHKKVMEFAKNYFK